MFSPGLITWDEVRDVRPAKWGLIDIDLVDEGEFLDRLGSGPQFAQWDPEAILEPALDLEPEVDVDRRFGSDPRVVEDWRLIADLGDMDMTISRLAVSPDGSKIAMVGKPLPEVDR